MRIFKIFPAEHARGPPKSRFWDLSCLKLTLPEKTTLRKVTKIGAPSLKNSEYAPDMKHFQKAYLRPFPGPNVFIFS